MAAAQTSITPGSSTAPTLLRAAAVIANSRGSSTASADTLSRSSTITAAAAECRTSARQLALLATDWASTTVSRLRPLCSSNLATAYSSRCAPSREPGLRAPLATARTCLPCSEKPVIIRSVSASLVFLQTMTVAEKLALTPHHRSRSVVSGWRRAANLCAA